MITFLFQSGAGLFPCTVADFGVEHPDNKKKRENGRSGGPIGRSGGGAGGRAGGLIVLRWRSSNYQNHVTINALNFVVCVSTFKQTSLLRWKWYMLANTRLR